MLLHFLEIKLEMIEGLSVWYNGEQRFHCFWLCFTYILMPHKMVIFIFVYLIFMSQIVLYSLHSALVLSF